MTHPPADLCLSCFDAPRCGVGVFCENCAADYEETRQPNPVPLRQWGTREAWETQNMENDYERWMAGDDL